MNTRRLIYTCLTALILLTTTLDVFGQTSVQQIISQLQTTSLNRVDKQQIKQRLHLIKEGLRLEPNNSELLYQQALLFADLEMYFRASVNVDRLLRKDSKNKKYLKLKNVIDRQMKLTNKDNRRLTEKVHRDPKDILARIALIKSELSLNRYKSALLLADEGLRFAPQNEDLLYQKTLILIDMGQYQRAKKTLDKLSKEPSGAAKATPLRGMVYRGVQIESERKAREAEVKREKAKQAKKAQAQEARYQPPIFFNLPVVPTEAKKNFVSLELYPSMVKDKSDTVDRRTFWNYGFLTYGHKTKYGTFMVGLDHRLRPGIEGFRYRVEGYPKLTKDFYLHLAYAYSNRNIFPRHDVIARAYIRIIKDYELTLGGQYFDISGEDLWAYNIWLSKLYAGHHWIALKPTIYSSNSTTTSIYVTAIYRYYFALPNHYLSFSTGAGRTPDLLDLDADGFQTVKAFHFFVNYQFPVFCKNFYLNLGAGYMKERYPTGLKRQKFTGLAGFKLLF